MVDTIRNAAYLQNVMRDGQPDGTIIPQMVRDFVVSTLSVATGITAAGTTQATATLLSSLINVVTTVPANAGVILPGGVRTVVMNRGANSLLIYPPVGASLEKLTANTPFPLQPGADAICIFDPSNAAQVYITTTINFAAIPTSLPAGTGIVWNDGGVLQIS